jgi:hypothetical protein
MRYFQRGKTAIDVVDTVRAHRCRASLVRGREGAPPFLLIVSHASGHPLTQGSQGGASTIDSPTYLRDLNCAQRAAVERGASRVDVAARMKEMWN